MWYIGTLLSRPMTGCDNYMPYIVDKFGCRVQTWSPCRKMTDRTVVKHWQSVGQMSCGKPCILQCQSTFMLHCEPLALNRSNIVLYVIVITLPAHVTCMVASSQPSRATLHETCNKTTCHMTIGRVQQDTQKVSIRRHWFNREFQMYQLSLPLQWHCN